MFKYFPKMIVQKYQDSTRRQNNFENARIYQSCRGEFLQQNQQIRVWWLHFKEIFEAPES